MNATSAAYFDTSGQPILRESVIVVADILGYARTIQEASQDHLSERLLEFVHLALGKSFPIVDDPSRKKWFAKMMTDNLIVAYPILNDGVGTFEFAQACFSIGHFQREMTKYGLAMRGGICVGRIHVSDLLVFPTPSVLVEMHEAEAIASSPRIVLLHSARRYLSEHSGQFGKLEGELNSFLWIDQDTAQFVNYLRPLAAPILGDRVDELVAHKQFIEGRLCEFSLLQRIYQKYVWMANYHNKFCRSVPSLNCPDLLVKY